MKLPRDVGAVQLIAKLQRLGYEVTRQTGSHIRLTKAGPRAHHVTVPNHDPLKVGTLNHILTDIALHLGTTKQDVIRHLTGH